MTTTHLKSQGNGLGVEPALGGLPKQAAESFGASPVYGALQAAGTMLRWSLRCIRFAVTPPFTWIPEAFAQCATAFRRCMLPLAATSAVYVTTYGLIMAGQFLIALGVSDRYGGAITTGIVRELATWLTMMILAGVAGSAITADLGARKIREELDALDVLGVDTVRYLVLPRVIGITAAALILPFICIFFSVIFLNLTVVPSRFNTGIPVILNGMAHSLTNIDLYALLVKHLLMGFFIGIVACERGLTCRRGAEGVGRAVNQCVVISFFGIWLINSFWNTAYLSFFPQASALRG